MNGHDDLVEDLATDAVASVVPMAGPIVKRLMRSVTAEWRRQSSTALHAAETASEMSREDFAEWVQSEPRAIPLYLKVLWAAGMNGHDETLRAMGAVLGRAARATHRGDDDAFDDAELALRAMDELTPRHFSVLRVLNDGEVVQEDGAEIYSEFTPRYVADELGMREETVHQCMLNLAGAGLTTSVPVLEATAYPVTDLGRAVIAAAKATATS